MARINQLIIGSDLADLVDQVNAYMAPMLNHKVQQADYEVVDETGITGQEYRILLQLDDTGAAQTDPYVLNTFNGRNPVETMGYFNTFVTANPALFISNPQYRPWMTGRKRHALNPIIAWSCVDAVNGLANWQVTAPPPAALAGDVTGPIAANTVEKIRNVTVAATAPAGGATLVYNATTLQYEIVAPIQFFVSGAAAQAAAGITPFINGTFVVIDPGSPTSDAGTWQVTANGGIAFPADYTKVSDNTDTASEFSVLDVALNFTAPKDGESVFAQLATSVGKTIFVDSVSGNDVTGLRGKPYRPFLTLAAAAAATGIAAGDVIVVRPGSYTVTTNLFVTGVNWYFEPGTTITFNDAGGTLWMWDGATVNVYGHADFVGVAGKGLVRTGAGVFQCRGVTGAWGSAGGDSIITASTYASGVLSLDVKYGLNCSTADRRFIYVNGPRVTGFVGGESLTIGSGTNGALEVVTGTIEITVEDMQVNGRAVKLTGGIVRLIAQALSGSAASGVLNSGGTLSITGNSVSVGMNSDNAASITNIIAGRWDGTATVSAGVARIRADSGATLGTIAVSGTGILHLDAQKFDMSSTGNITVSAGSIYLTSNFIAQTVAQTILAVSGTGTAVVNIGSITIGTDAPAVSISGGTLAGLISSITHSGSGSAARGIYQTGGTCDLVMGLLAMTNSGSYAGIRIDGGTSVCRIKADAITAISTNEGAIHNGSQTPTLDLDIGRVSGANASGVATISTLGPTGSIRVGTLTSTSARAFAMTSGSTSVNLSLNFGVVSNTGGSAEVIALAQGFVDVQIGLIKNAGAGVAVSVDTQTATVGRIAIGAIINSGNAPGISLTTKQNQLDVSLGRYIGNSYAINISTSGADATACNYSINLGQIITTYAGGAVVISGHDINASVSAQIIRNLSTNSNAVGLSIANSGTVAAFVECPDISGYRGVKIANTGALTISVEAQRITGNVAEAIQVTSAGGAITGSVEAEQITGATDGISLAAGTWDFSLGRVTATSGKALACLTGGTPTFRNAVFFGSANQPGADLLNSITARFIGCTFIGGAGATESITGTATAKFLTPCSANLPKAAGITEQVNALNVSVDAA